METVLQTNIFFYITSAAVIVLTILVGIILFYVLLIVRNVKHLTDRLRRGGDMLAQDLQGLRTKVKEDGGKIFGFIGGLSKMFWMRTSRPRTKKSTKSSSSE